MTAACEATEVMRDLADEAEASRAVMVRSRDMILSQRDAVLRVWSALAQTQGAAASPETVLLHADACATLGRATSTWAAQIQAINRTTLHMLDQVESARAVIGEAQALGELLFNKGLASGDGVAGNANTGNADAAPLAQSNVVVLAGARNAARMAASLETCRSLRAAIFALRTALTADLDSLAEFLPQLERLAAGFALIRARAQDATAAALH
jgi:hypothetical protein